MLIRQLRHRPFLIGYDLERVGLNPGAVIDGYK